MVCPELPHIRLQRDRCLIHDGSRIPISIFFNLSPSSTNLQLLYCASEEKPNPSTDTRDVTLSRRSRYVSLEIDATFATTVVEKKCRNQNRPAGSSRTSGEE